MSSDAVLTKEVKKYRREHPGCSDDEVLRNLLKHNVPQSMPGTPAWHHKSLQDLLCMVENIGMPHIFLTLTADEVTHLRWDSINDLETFLHSFNAGFTFQVVQITRKYTYFYLSFVSHNIDQLLTGCTYGMCCYLP